METTPRKLIIVKVGMMLGDRLYEVYRYEQGDPIMNYNVTVGYENGQAVKLFQPPTEPGNTDIVAMIDQWVADHKVQKVINYYTKLTDPQLDRIVSAIKKIGQSEFERRKNKYESLLFKYPKGR